MRKIFIILLAVLGASGCAMITTETPSNIALPLDVPTNSVYYVDVTTESITFTGNPAADFGATRVLYSDPANDSTNKNVAGAVTMPFHELTDIYMAFTRNNLYFGFKTTAFPDGSTWDLLTAGAAYIFIDNGITSGDYSKGPAIINSGGLTAAGISGELGQFENIGVMATNGRKFTFFYKQYRPATSRDCQGYKFASGSSVHENWTGASASVGWQIYTIGAATEIQIPLHYIFGDGASNVNTFYVAFRVDGGLADANLNSQADPAKKAQYTNAAAIDWAPEQNDLLITNWLAITNLTK